MPMDSAMILIAVSLSTRATVFSLSSLRVKDPSPAAVFSPNYVIGHSVQCQESLIPSG